MSRVREAAGGKREQAGRCSGGDNEIRNSLTGTTQKVGRGQCG